MNGKWSERSQLFDNPRTPGLELDRRKISNGNYY